VIISGTIETSPAAKLRRALLTPHDEDEAPPDKKEELGQFLTPAPVAEFMASLFQSRWRSVNLLDAGAGGGALTVALVRRLCRENRKPRSVSVTAYEIDPAMVELLRGNLSTCQRECERVGIEFSATARNADFIGAIAPTLRGDLFAPQAERFNAAIVNPPYRKIRSDSPTRQLLRSAGIETSNLYAGFLALIVRLLGDGGEMVAITPRSFCNGPYFRPFRNDFLAQMSLCRLHVFDSRSAAFRGDDVLQENIIVHAMKSAKVPEQVLISSSSGEPGAKVKERAVAFSEVVSPSDPEQFIHLVADDGQAKARDTMTSLSTKLAQLGLSVSTGRVVDFRAEEYLRQQPARDTAPLIYPCHFDGGFVRWPKSSGRKPNAIVADAHTRELLVPAEVYVLVKRFTSKEERRRVVACIFDPARVPASAVGFENHLNYFHVRGHGLAMDLAKGLAAFLNSTLVDTYFRQFNGHTQVNATDLRNLRYPTRVQLVHLGRSVEDPAANQRELDTLLEKELNATS
jgi:adenine-specific DNA-methyltransferase